MDIHQTDCDELNDPSKMPLNILPHSISQEEENEGRSPNNPGPRISHGVVSRCDSTSSRSPAVDFKVPGILKPGYSNVSSVGETRERASRCCSNFSNSSDNSSCVISQTPSSDTTHFSGFSSMVVSPTLSNSKGSTVCLITNHLGSVPDEVDANLQIGINSNVDTKQNNDAVEFFVPTIDTMEESSTITLYSPPSLGHLSKASKEDNTEAEANGSSNTSGPIVQWPKTKQSVRIRRKESFDVSSENLTPIIKEPSIGFGEIKSVLKNRKFSTPEQFSTSHYKVSRAASDAGDRTSSTSINIPFNTPNRNKSSKFPMHSSLIEQETSSKKDISFFLPEDDINNENSFNERAENDNLNSQDSQACSSDVILSTNGISPNLSMNLQRKRKMPVRLTIPMPQNSLENLNNRPVSLESGIILSLDELKPSSPSVVTFSQTPSIISNYSRNGKWGSCR